MLLYVEIPRYTLKIISTHYWEQYTSQEGAQHWEMVFKDRVGRGAWYKRAKVEKFLEARNSNLRWFGDI